MSEFSVGNGAWVLVGDGRRALFFQNHGDAELLDLRVVETRIDENPATRDQGTDQARPQLCLQRRRAQRGGRCRLA